MVDAVKTDAHELLAENEDEEGKEQIKVMAPTPVSPHACLISLFRLSFVNSRKNVPGRISCVKEHAMNPLLNRP